MPSDVRGRWRPCGQPATHIKRTELRRPSRAEAQIRARHERDEPRCAEHATVPYQGELLRFECMTLAQAGLPEPVWLLLEDAGATLVDAHVDGDRLVLTVPDDDYCYEVDLRGGTVHKLERMVTAGEHLSFPIPPPTEGEAP